MAKHPLQLKIAAGVPLTPDEQAQVDQMKALDDTKLMGAAGPQDVVTEPNVTELPAQPTNAPGPTLTRVPVPQVAMKAPAAPPVRPARDVSATGGEIDPVADDAPVDFSSRVQGARDQANDIRLAASLGRAGERVSSALGGTKSDPSAYGAMEEHAENIEKQPALDIKFEEMARKHRMALALKDPSHPVNQRARAITPKFLRDLYGASFDNMTAEELKGSNPFMAKLLEGADKSERETWKLQNDAAKTENSVQKDQAQLAGQADQRNINAYMAEKMPQNEVIERFKITRTDNLAKDTGKFSEIGEALKMINQQVPGIIHGRLPKGFNISMQDRVAMGLPDKLAGVASWVATPEGQKFKNLLTTARDLVQRGRSGAVLNEGEEAFYKRQFADSALANPKAIAENLGNLTKLLRSKMRDRQASAQVGGKYAVLDDYEGTGGFTFNDPIFTPPPEEEDAPAPKAPPPPAAPKASGLVRVKYPQDPSGKVYSIPADKVGTDGSVPVEE